MCREAQLYRQLISLYDFAIAPIEKNEMYKRILLAFGFLLVTAATNAQTTVQVLVTVTGLEPGPTPGDGDYAVVLQNNGIDTFTATADGTFSFATALSPGESYDVTILFQPLFQTCSVSNGSGTVPANPTANITDPLVTCAPSATSTPTPVPALPLPVLGLLAAIVLGFGLRRLRRG